ncbi:hypothetical protein [Hafnia paralvei]|uniref:hypothetical protein n=1 Tax=Hafnia paralvei TaxID=546367 RepID=UPI00163BE629|nr:hypothetical protein [Hafnia paralvei]
MNNKKSNEQIVTLEEAMRKCFVSMSKNCLELRPKETFNGSLNGKILFFIAFFINISGLGIVFTPSPYEKPLLPIFLILVSCFLFCMLEWALVSRITALSNIVFNRKTQKCYAYYNNKKYINHVNDVIIYGGAKTMISMHRCDKNGIIITKNIEIDDEWSIKPISDYIKTFISHGSNSLIIPAEYEWSGLENIYISFPPCKSLCHYAPWPFCGRVVDPIEKMLKIYMWPIYTFIMFPINMIFSLLWYPFTKIFNIKPHPVPEEAYEGDDSIRVTPEMAAKGIRP